MLTALWWITLLAVADGGAADLVASDAGMAPVSLDALLTLAGRAELARETRGCAFMETTTVESLADDGHVEGTLTRTHAVQAKGGEVLSRTTVSESTTGEVPSLFKVEQKPNADRDQRLSPFHPEKQGEFRFRLEGQAAAGRVRVSFVPREEKAQRATGVAVLDSDSGEVVSMSARPSKLPMGLDRMTFDMEFSPGPCGMQASRAKAAGAGGFFLYKVRFRSVTTLSGHRALPARP